MFFFFNDTAPTEIYTLSLHDALPIFGAAVGAGVTLLLRQGPSGRRPVGPLIRYAGRGAALAGLAGMGGARWAGERGLEGARDRKSTRLNSSHSSISYAVFCLKKKKKK